MIARGRSRRCDRSATISRRFVHRRRAAGVREPPPRTLPHLVGAAESNRVVVEIGRRGKLVVGEPYFTPGVPLVLESKGIGDLRPGDLAVVRTGRGRARVEQALGPGRRIESV